MPNTSHFADDATCRKPQLIDGRYITRAVPACFPILASRDDSHCFRAAFFLRRAFGSAAVGVEASRRLASRAGDFRVPLPRRRAIAGFCRQARLSRRWACRATARD